MIIAGFLVGFDFLLLWGFGVFLGVLLLLVVVDLLGFLFCFEWSVLVLGLFLLGFCFCFNCCLGEGGFLFFF